MYANGFFRFGGALRKSFSQALGAQYCGQVVLNEVLYFIVEDTAKHQDGSGDPILAQFNAFFKYADAQIVRACCNGGFGARNGSVSVGVGLHDRHYFHLWVQQAPDGEKIMAEAVEVDFRESGAGQGCRSIGIYYGLHDVKCVSYSRRVLPVAESRPILLTVEPAVRTGRHDKLPSSECFFLTR